MEMRSPSKRIYVGSSPIGGSIIEGWQSGKKG